MKKVREVLKEIFIEGLSGMATGLFATLIIGTIIQQIGKLIPGVVGDYLFFIGKVAGVVTGAGIGIGVAQRLKASPLTTVSAAAAGMVGAFAGKMIEGTILADGNIVLAGVGEPLGAFLAVITCVYVGRLVSGSHGLWDFRADEEKGLDQGRRYETGCLMMKRGRMKQCHQLNE